MYCLLIFANLLAFTADRELKIQPKTTQNHVLRIFCFFIRPLLFLFFNLIFLFYMLLLLFLSHITLFLRNLNISYCLPN